MNVRIVKSIGVFFLSGILLAGCGSKGKVNSSDAYITGKISNANGQTLYFEELTPEKITILDSVKVEKDGSFSINKKARGMNYYRLRLGKEQASNMYASPQNVIVFISDSTEKITIEADGKNMNMNFKVTGSTETTLLMQINEHLLKGEKTIDSLNQIYEQTPDKFNQLESEKIFNQVIMDRIAFMKKFISEHPDNFVALQALPFLSPDTDLDTYKMIHDKLSKKYPTNGWVVNLGIRIEDMNFLAKGTTAPDFTIKTPEGKDISLKDFRGKFVLIDFWASWCRPCRMENPNVVAAYNKYKGKGFTVFGVSLDQQKEPWVEAIQKDGLTWQHGSDLGYWDSAPAKLYKISSIPYNILVDKEGKVVAKNLRGEDLEKQLAELMP